MESFMFKIKVYNFFNAWPYIIVLLLTFLLLIITFPFKEFLGEVNIGMIFLLPVLFSAAMWGTGPGLVSAGVSAITFDFFFIPPQFSFSVSDFRYLISFIIFFLVGLITGSLSNRLKQQVNLRAKLAEQAREAQNLIEAERLRTALFNSLSHDLRTPLASIIGAVTGLLEGENVYNPEARRALLSSIQQGATRMHRFINNLLDMARLESGMLKLKKEWCDVQDIVGVVMGQFGENLSSRRLKVSIEQNLPFVMGDFILLEQVFINVLDNALKYSESGSEITISACKMENHVKVSIADVGQPIPDNDIGKIFDKFYRLTSPLQVSGTGLGLAICKGIIEAHGGKIWAENNPSGGVIISFELPVSEDYANSMQKVNEGEIDG